MKAAQFGKYGGPEVVEINDTAKPTPGKGQILVEVYVASINPIDWKIREGYLKDFAPLSFPVTMGGDFSGVVVEIGEGISKFKVGDEVYGQSLILNGGSGSIAQFAVSNEKNSARKPKKITHNEAASLPLAGVSALQALTQHINLKKNHKILIQGGAGGIGSIAIQIAKSMGAYVATTVSSKDIDYVKGLGADTIIDYKKEKFDEKINDLDGVFDASSGGNFSEECLKVFKKGGIFVSMTGQTDERLAKKFGVKTINEQTNTSAGNLDLLRDLVENNAVKPQVDRVFPLERTREAFEYKETGHPRGKVVVSIKNER